MTIWAKEIVSVKNKRTSGGCDCFDVVVKVEHGLLRSLRNKSLTIIKTNQSIKGVTWIDVNTGEDVHLDGCNRKFDLCLISMYDEQCK